MVVMDAPQLCNTLRGAGPLKSTMDVIWAAQVLLQHASNKPFKQLVVLIVASSRSHIVTRLGKHA